MQKIKVKQLIETLIPGCLVISTEPLYLLSDNNIQMRDDYSYHYDNAFQSVEKETKFIVVSIQTLKEVGTYNNLIIHANSGIMTEPLYKLNISLYHINKNIKLMYGMYFENYDTIVSCGLKKIS